MVKLQFSSPPGYEQSYILIKLCEVWRLPVGDRMKQKIVALLYLGNYTLGHALLVNFGDKKKRNFVNRTETWILFLTGMLVGQLLDIS